MRLFAYPARWRTGAWANLVSPLCYALHCPDMTEHRSTKVRQLPATLLDVTILGQKARGWTKLCPKLYPKLCPKLWCPKSYAQSYAHVLLHGVHAKCDGCSCRNKNQKKATRNKAEYAFETLHTAVDWSVKWKCKPWKQMPCSSRNIANNCKTKRYKKESRCISDRRRRILSEHKKWDSVNTAIQKQYWWGIHRRRRRCNLLTRIWPVGGVMRHNWRHKKHFKPSSTIPRTHLR